MTSPVSDIDSETPPVSQTPDAARPVIRLRPKRGKPFLRGGPWVYADEVVMDRRARAIPAGAVVAVEDSERVFVGAAAWNPISRIVLRRLDPDPGADIDAAWLEAKFAAALAVRTALTGGAFYRLIHAEADGMPGVVVDRFGDFAVMQPNAAWADQRRDAICAALMAATGVKGVTINGESRVRSLEGLETGRWSVGEAPPPLIEVPQNGAVYLADLVEGQKTGLYYDQRPNHAFAAQLAPGRRVLDVFSHVGGFGLACAAAGAKSVLMVDSSRRALDLAEDGAARAELSGCAVRQGDAFAVMTDLCEAGETFDQVICDPPAFAPNKQALDAGLRAYERVAYLGARLTAPGGWLTLCSCSHNADPETFREACAKGLRRARRSGRIVHAGRAGPDHPTHPHLPETGYLKTFTFYVT